MKYNLGAKPKEFASIARLLGEDITGLSEADAAMKAVTAVESLRRDIGIPTRLRDLGVKEEHFKPFAEKTFNIKRLMRVNPRYPTQDEIESLFREAW
jgi:alcohol dehydrogenase class IV